MKDHVVLIIRRRNKVLFVRRSMQKKDLPGKWAFASGTCESDESFETTARREAKEEFGIEVEPKRLLATHELPHFGVNLHFLVCDIIAGTPKIMAPDEFDELRWQSLTEFFAHHDDSQIGHGLVWLRANPQIWQTYDL